MGRFWRQQLRTLLKSKLWCFARCFRLLTFWERLRWIMYQTGNLFSCNSTSFWNLTAVHVGKVGIFRTCTWVLSYFRSTFCEINHESLSLLQITLWLFMYTMENIFSIGPHCARCAECGRNLISIYLIGHNRKTTNGMWNYLEQRLQTNAQIKEYCFRFFGHQLIAVYKCVEKTLFTSFGIMFLTTSCLSHTLSTFFDMSSASNGGLQFIRGNNSGTAPLYLSIVVVGLHTHC